MNRVLQSLWVGPALSTMERLAIASFLAHGHELHLYAYGEPAGVPAGTTLLDARQILPESAIFRYRDYETYSGFANFFRYKLLLERGGWWVDLDLVCLKPFDFEEPYIFSTERHEGRVLVNNGVLKAPPGSELMAHCWEVCQAKDPAEIRHGETGPRLMAASVERLGLDAFARSPEAFCPLPWLEWHRAIHPFDPCEFGPETYAVHLWNEVWRRNELDKDDRYDPRCLYERLKQRFLG